MKIELTPIGFVRTKAKSIPRHWTVSDVEGEIVINEEYKEGLRDIKAGQHIVVIFYFHQSPQFTHELLVQKPHHSKESKGVFSICSPVRPNPIGMSVVEVTGIDGCTLHIKGLDMLDGTPVIDIKPMVTMKEA
ncbi:tRNA (N6-threonylcarbamoyladenosine(37)-N6)-methyltransferase TrmO [Dissulfurispira thermophila]|uniref:tRNA (N6-threonylcarbamoyladenosine(37)-N6)-methyltransferase TrmO n=1 Tax=Dissulfurispira thermophila TaxID=2715679 RepID=A0A7G1H4I4_9BACT|nr:tRNA (N6-threonylcarbamoyladenosine(37)-N6)-methyltransferase TrmO [Dissulfurispira thermophila]BCB97062.1 tRNA (N6-threonylcarbamoyladenosine(37)-N6)-methyltransferase TrmO [Dissulfurispira thermophila]